MCSAVHEIANIRMGHLAGSFGIGFRAESLSGHLSAANCLDEEGVTRCYINSCMIDITSFLASNFISRPLHGL